MFSNVKMGDSVFDYNFQKWGNISQIEYNCVYSLKVDFNDGSVPQSYTIDGKVYDCYETQSLFWDEVKPIIPPRKPVPKLEVDQKLRVWTKGGKEKYNRHFSHFDKNGVLYCFSNGKNSFTSSGTDYSPWYNWELVD